MSDSTSVLSAKRAEVMTNVGVTRVEIRRLERKLQVARDRESALMDDADALDKAIGLLSHTAE